MIPFHQRQPGRERRRPAAENKPACSIWYCGRGVVALTLGHIGVVAATREFHPVAPLAAAAQLPSPIVRPLDRSQSGAAGLGAPTKSAPTG